MSSADRIDEHASAGRDGPLLICYDGSEDAKLAIESAGVLLAAKPVLVVTVWQPTAALGSFAWSGATANMINFVELDRAGAKDGGRVADEGVRIAQAAGLEAEPLAVKATGPVWKTIIEAAGRHDAAAIVIGSRGLTGVRSMLLGSAALSCITPTGLHWSSIAPATTTPTDQRPSEGAGISGVRSAHGWLAASACSAAPGGRSVASYVHRHGSAVPRRQLAIEAKPPTMAP